MEKTKNVKANEEKEVVVLDENGNPIETPEDSKIEKKKEKINIIDKAKGFIKNHEVVFGVACGIIVGVIGKILLDNGNSEDDDDDCDMVYDDDGLSSFNDNDDDGSDSDDSDDE